MCVRVCVCVCVLFTTDASAPRRNCTRRPPPPASGHSRPHPPWQLSQPDTQQGTCREKVGCSSDPCTYSCAQGRRYVRLNEISAPVEAVCVCVYVCVLLQALHRRRRSRRRPRRIARVDSDAGPPAAAARGSSLRRCRHRHIREARGSPAQ